MAIDNWTLAVFSPLMLCSLVALMLILERSVILLRLPRLGPEKNRQLLSTLSQGQLEQARIQLQSKPLFYQAAAQQVFEMERGGKALCDDAAATAMLPVADRLRARMSGIVTVATLAPMFGLLGTVVGLMRAFREIGLKAGPVEPALVADGLWQALSTTAVGLVIAAACIVAHALLSSRIRRSLAEATQVLNNLSLYLSAHQSRNRGDTHNDSL